MSVAFLDLSRQTREVEAELAASLAQTLDESTFIGGAAVAEFESAWAAYCGVAHAVGCGSGADALALALRAIGVGAGDEVVVPANTCVPTVAAVVAAGATPVLADVDRATLNLDPERAAQAVTPRTKAIVPVHLYGRCADVDALRELGPPVVEDAAHAHGATLRGRRAGSLGDAAAFSFYPTKNLAALGDAGAVTTNDPDVAERVRELRSFGRHGTQSRLDTLQAAALLTKLPHLDRWNERRRDIASRYRSALAVHDDDAGHVYHLFAAQYDERDAERERLAASGIETLVHYTPAIHERPEWRMLARDLPESERACARVLSLPLYPQLTDEEVDEVVDAL